MIPVNQALQEVLGANPDIENAGLLLDKYHADCPKQEDQKRELAAVARLAGRQSELENRLARRRAALDGLAARRWTRVTSGPLTLQLSRAGSFENAGICLHPVYGFVYLPGTGVKGMARSFAEVVEQAPAGEVERVFGREAAKDEESAAGAVVFHEAWPVRWPKLVVDVVNNHHPKYYAGDGDSNPPDDFEDPNPVCFLSIPAGTEFEFAVSSRQGARADERLLEQARRWVEGALTLLGAGAKTNAGYGRFKAETMPELGEGLARFTATLVFETPAFLAGASQQADDCELRPATLRGLLRWWWRTLHAARLGVSELRKLEAQIWGDTKAGGAVALSLAGPEGPAAPHVFEPDEILRHYKLEPPQDRTTPGIKYGSWGMWRTGGKPARHYLAPGAAWKLTVTARARGGLSAEQVLDQARLAVWLMGRYGGAGAKARRGFGSLRVELDGAPGGREEALERAAAVRPRCQAPSVPVCSSIERMQETVLRLRGQEPWFALDQLASAYQSFASSEKHQRAKAALGLPRRIHKPPNQERLQHPAGDYRRHSSPLHFHVFRDGQGYAVRIAAFASPRLPDLNTSAGYLDRCVKAMERWLQERAGRAAPVPAVQPAPASAVRPAAPPGAPKVGERVTGVLLEKSAKGTWKVQVEGFSAPGPIQNSPEMPGTFKPEDRVTLKVAVSKPAEPAFKWVKE